MENKSNPLISQALLYGLYYALVSIILSLVMWMVNFIPTSIGGSMLMLLVTIVIAFVLLYYFTKKYRDDSLGGYITFGKAFVFAFLVVVFSTLITAVYNYIFNAFIDPDYLERVMNTTVTSMEERLARGGMSADQIDSIVGKMEQRMSLSPLKSSLKSIPGGIIFGTIVALITSAIVKKSQEVFPENK